MFKESLLEKILRLLPLILLLLSMYYIYIYWIKYQGDSKLNTAINQTVTMQKIQYNLLDELLCIPVVTSVSDVIKEKCATLKMNTDLLLSKMNVKNKISFSPLVDAIRSDFKEASMNDIGTLMEKQSVQNLSDNIELPVVNSVTVDQSLQFNSLSLYLTRQ